VLTSVLDSLGSAHHRPFSPERPLGASNVRTSPGQIAKAQPL
jgi:hypothetical protein